MGAVSRVISGDTLEEIKLAYDEWLQEAEGAGLSSHMGWDDYTPEEREECLGEDGRYHIFFRVHT